MQEQAGFWKIRREKRINGRKYYECECTCGTVKDVYYRSILTGSSISCGCHRAKLQREKFQDLTGKTFGKLFVMERDMQKSAGVYWICRCECGNIKSIKGSQLTKKSKPTISCGCEQRRISRKTGKRTIIKNNQKHLDENMRYNTNLQMITSQKLCSNNKSGVTGVSFDKTRQKWTAHIQCHGKKIFLGRFESIDDAVKARKTAEKELFEPIIMKRNIERKEATDGNNPEQHNKISG